MMLTACGLLPSLLVML